MDHRHALLARTAWEAAAQSDREALAEVCAPDMVWHASGRGPRSGEIEGLEAVFDYLATLGDAADRFDSFFEDALVGEDRVAVLFRLKGERRGKVLDTGFILIFRVAQDRIAEIWAVPRDQHAVDEFWA